MRRGRKSANMSQPIRKRARRGRPPGRTCSADDSVDVYRPIDIGSPSNNGGLLVRKEEMSDDYENTVNMIELGSSINQFSPNSAHHRIAGNTEDCTSSESVPILLFKDIKKEVVSEDEEEILSSTTHDDYRSLQQTTHDEYRSPQQTTHYDYHPPHQTAHDDYHSPHQTTHDDYRPPQQTTHDHHYRSTVSDRWTTQEAVSDILTWYESAVSLIEQGFGEVIDSQLSVLEGNQSVDQHQGNIQDHNSLNRYRDLLPNEKIRVDRKLPTRRVTARKRPSMTASHPRQSIYGHGIENYTESISVEDMSPSKRTIKATTRPIPLLGQETEFDVLKMRAAYEISSRTGYAAEIKERAIRPPIEMDEEDFLLEEEEVNEIHRIHYPAEHCYGRKFLPSGNRCRKKEEKGSEVWYKKNQDGLFDECQICNGITNTIVESRNPVVLRALDQKFGSAFSSMLRIGSPSIQFCKDHVYQVARKPMCIICGHSVDDQLEISVRLAFVLGANISVGTELSDCMQRDERDIAFVCRKHFGKRLLSYSGDCWCQICQQRVAFVDCCVFNNKQELERIYSLVTGKEFQLPVHCRLQVLHACKGHINP